MVDTKTEREQPVQAETWINMRSILLTAAALSLGAIMAMAGPAGAQDQPPCLMCHAEPALFAGNQDSSRLVVTAEIHAGSLHGALGLQCASCHQDVTFPHPAELAPVSCGPCHGSVMAVYENSVHGYAVQRGNQRAPTCAACHGSHDILRSADPNAPTHRSQLASTCANCHGPEGLLTDQLVRLPQTATAYARSVHGNGLANGLADTPSCVDCHGVHDLRGPADPASRINVMNVAQTCGQCHADVQAEYAGSIHGRALQAGVTDSPNCTGCHGEHLILSPSDPEATTYAGRLAHETCGNCHEDPTIIAKYGLTDDVVESYVDSYHGWASRRGYESAATCVSCHTAHTVLPEADSASTIHPGNVVATCAQCHENADERFAASYTHATTSITKNPVNRLIRNIYLLLITITIGGMVLHNLVIMNYYVMRRRKLDAASPALLRLDLTQIVQHILLTVSFVMLVITGFALRFPEAWWVEVLSYLGMTEPVRADLHRINAVLLVMIAVSHVFYIIARKRGRDAFRAMVPQVQDVKDVYDAMRYYTWRSEKRVEFGRYDYAQKAEYWALVWGTAVMALTGMVLWFPEQAVRIVPSIMVSVSQTIHYYEAWLATLAILVWHFFFVVFHPDAYPMSWTWLSGKMPKQMAAKHHARWYEEQLQAEEQEGDAEPAATAPDDQSRV